MADKVRSRYIKYLPGIYQKQGTLFQQFLLPFEDAFAEFEALLDVVDGYFAAGLAPEQDFLPWLSTWVALTLDEEWEEDKRRRLLSQAVELYRWRGTTYGLKRYLEIYTGLAPEQIEILEGEWPGGMQIGVASQIGGTEPDKVALNPIARAQRAEDLVYHDYYVIDAQAKPQPGQDGPAEPSIQHYYGAEDVARVEAGDDFVTLWHRKEPSSAPDHYEPATIIRRNQLIYDRYSIVVGVDPEVPVAYKGDTFLIETVALPYRFIVNLRPEQDQVDKFLQRDRIGKVRAIIDLEKPAHTEYYLKVTPMVSEGRLQFMRIGVRSSIGLNATVA